MSDKKRRSLEECFDAIDEIINKMEEDDVALDQSFELYKQGIGEIKEANEMLDTIEKAMLVLNESGEMEAF